MVMHIRYVDGGSRQGSELNHQEVQSSFALQSAATVAECIARWNINITIAVAESHASRDQESFDVAANINVIYIGRTVRVVDGEKIEYLRIFHI